jgi:hypothetical protein
MNRRRSSHVWASGARLTPILTHSASTTTSNRGCGEPEPAARK